MGAIPFLNPINLNQLELQNVKIQNLAADPSTPVLGQAYFNTAANKLRTYNGASWDQMGTSVGTVSSVTLTQPTAGLTITNSGVAQTSVGAFTFTFTGELAGLVALATNGLVTRTASGSYTGRQIAGTVNQITVTNPDGVAGNPTLALPQNIATSSDVTFNSLTIGETQTSGTNTAHAATIGYVNNLVNGLSWKDVVRLASTANVVIATGGLATVDGVVTVAGDRVLLKNQTTVSENGIYVVAAGAWARSTDANTWANLVGSVVPIQGGATQADTMYYSTAALTGTLGTTDPAFSEMPTPMTTLAGSGLSKTGNTLTVNVDNSSIYLNAGVLTVKAAGITNAMLYGAIDAGKIGSGALGVNYGGTGNQMGALTSGGLIWAFNSSTMACCGMSTQYGVFLGGGGGVPTWTAAGVTGQVFLGNTGAAPTWGAVALASMVSGVLPGANGGTGSAFVTFTGPTAARSFALPDASATILTTNAAVTVAQGGTGAATAAAARTALGATTKYAASFGDGAASAFTITHNLGTTDIVVMFYIVATGERVEIDFLAATANTVTFTLPVIPTASQYRIVCIG